MVLYELFCIARPDLERAANVDLFRRIGTSVIEQGGVLRKICNAGTRPLPYRIRNQGEYMYEGQYWSLIFNLSPRVAQTFRKRLRSEKELVRCCVFRHATTLAEEAKSLLAHK